jgi:hypothetical protein
MDLLPFSFHTDGPFSSLEYLCPAGALHPFLKSAREFPQECIGALFAITISNCSASLIDCPAIDRSQMDISYFIVIY